MAMRRQTRLEIVDALDGELNAKSGVAEANRSSLK